jgi:hypothetical protein
MEQGLNVPMAITRKMVRSESHALCVNLTTIFSMLFAGTRNGKTQYVNVSDTSVKICALLCISPIQLVTYSRVACRLCVLLLLLLLRGGWA